MTAGSHSLHDSASTAVLHHQRLHAYVQAVVDKARAALLNTRLTGEAALPSGHQASASHPAAHSGGFYMGEVMDHDFPHQAAECI